MYQASVPVFRHYLARVAEMEAELARLRKAAGEFAEYHGGCGHHPDECPGTDKLCVRVHNLSAALSAPPAATRPAEPPPITIRS